MKEKDIREMQRLIDEGVQRAQHRLWQRAGAAHQTLVVFRGGRIVEMIPPSTPEPAQYAARCTEGDPLARRQR